MSHRKIKDNPLSLLLALEPLGKTITVDRKDNIHNMNLYPSKPTDNRAMIPNSLKTNKAHHALSVAIDK